MNSKIFIPFLLILFVFNACRKEKDLQAPKLRIQYPLSSSSFTVPFTLAIGGDVSDDVRLEYITVTVLQPNSQVLGSVTIPLTGTQYTFRQEFILDDVHLLSGIYTINVKVSDGTQISSQYVQINVSGIEAILEKVFMSTKNNNQSKLVYLNGGSLTDFYNFSNAPRLFAVNSYFQKLAWCSQSGDPLIILNPSSAAIETTIPNELSSATFFSSIHYSGSDHLLAVGNANQEVKFYSFNGSNLNTIQGSASFIPKEVKIFANAIVIAEKHSSSSSEKITIYSSISHALLFSTAVSFSTQSILESPSGEPLLFVNESGVGKLKQVQTSSGSISDVFTFSGNLVKAVKANGNNYLVLLNDGIYNYSISSNTATQLIFLNGIIDLQYDYLNEVVYCVSPFQLTSYAYPSGNLIGQIGSTDTLVSLQLLYNK